MIFHITNPEYWVEARKTGLFNGNAFLGGGFIHCSTQDQLLEVADYLFHGRKDMILLVIDENEVAPEVRYEDAGNGKLYPHIYGPLNIDAVVKVLPFSSGSDGSFTLPDLATT